METESLKQPYSLEAEQSLLGSVIIDPPSMNEIVSAVQPKYFFLPLHRMIFSCLMAMFETARPIDAVTLLDEMKITEDGVAYMILSKSAMKKFGIEEGETEGFVNIPLSVGKVKLSCLLKEDDGFIRVSLRSKKGISANRCASEFFNGGGHEQASGGRLHIPEDIRDISEAAGYIERVTHIFMNRDNVQNIQ